MMLQDHCDVAVIGLYDSMGTCTISGILCLVCYGTPRYGHFNSGGGLSKGFFSYGVQRGIYMYIHSFTSISRYLLISPVSS